MHKLVEESRKLTTFYTPRWLKHFKELHYRVNSTAEIPNEQEQKVASQETNAISIYDNIINYGMSQEEHNWALQHVLRIN